MKEACTACGVVTPEGARFCPSCGAPVASAPVERRLVTAFFCDVVGSTALAERLDAEVLSAVMGEYTLLAREAIERNGGTVAVFHGDGAVGIFGLPVAREDDAARAAQTGLDLLASLPGAKEAAAQGVVLQARVGIETGEVLGDLAMVASGAIPGDVLNTAARLQAEAEPGTVVAGGEAIRLLHDRAQLRPLPPMILKGKAEPVTAAVVVSVDAGPRRPSASPFVGRERHVLSLGRALEEAVADGAPVLATVLGDPGIGKSRLLNAFLGDLPGTTVLRTSVPAAGEGASLAPVVDLVLAAAGGGEPAQAAERLGRLLEGRPDAVALEAALRSLLGLGDEGSAEHAWALRRLLETLASRGPVVVVLDDLHWAASALFDLVEDIAKWTRGPVLVLCAARLDLLDVRSSWGGGLQRSLTLALGPLAAEESRTLADALLGSGSDEIELLVSRAEGNPLFLEQLAAESVELGEAWDASSAPTTIRALLEARLDRCLPEVARVLGVASVQGSVFHLDVVRGLVPTDIDLDDALRQADRARLASELEPNIGAFAHALVRETAYGRLPKATRADLHAAIAELLPADDDERVGVHLERAAALRAELGHPDPDLERRAGERLARTGARAFARLDMVAAYDLLERAADLLPLGSPARLELLPDLSIVLMDTGRTAEAQALLEGAVEEAAKAGSRRDAIRLRLQQLALFVYTDVSHGQIRDGIIEGRALVEELENLHDDVGLARGWSVVDYLHWLLGEMAMVEEAAGRSVAHAVRGGRLREQLQSASDQANSLISGPKPVAEIRRVAAERCGSDNVVVAAGGEAAAAAAAGLAGDISGYREAEMRWRRLVEAGGLEWPGADQAISGLALVLLEIGDAQGAEKLLRESLDTMERLGDAWLLNVGGWLLPFALARQGRTDEAAVLAEANEELFTVMGADDGVFRGLALSAARAERGRREEALAFAREAADVARASDSNLFKSLALENLAGLLHETDPVAATSTLEEVAAIDATWGNVVGAERVATTLASWRSIGEGRS